MKFIKVLFLPITWAIGFLWPLIAQTLLALELSETASAAYLVGGVVALAWGVMAQLRGSWIWVK